MLHLKHQVYKTSWIRNLQNPQKFYPYRNKQPYHALLNINNKITYIITGQQAPTHLHMHYLEYVTKSHIAIHTI